MTIVQRLDHQSCGCGSPVAAQNLITIDDALLCIAKETKPITTVQRVPLAAALGRVLSQPVQSLGMTPSFHNAAMDGYAVNSGDLNGSGPWTLKVQECIAAGHKADIRLLPGSAAQIFTGAPMPEGADAVVMQENTDRTETTIKIRNKVGAGTHMRRAGEDMMPGTPVLDAGQRLTARDIAAAAAAGHEELEVRARLRVALIVTGDEVRKNGDTRKDAEIWDVNTPMLRAAISGPDVELCHLCTVKDTREVLATQLDSLSKEVDLIITTGGISVGDEDHVKPALTQLGGWIGFTGVAMKPGKPVSFGRLNSATWLGLPGNPLSAFVTWQVFGRSICKALSGNRSGSAPRRHVVLSHDLHHKPGRCELRLAKIVGFDQMGREVAEFAAATQSGRVAQLPMSDGLLFIPSDVSILPEGALAELQPF